MPKARSWSWKALRGIEPRHIRSEEPIDLFRPHFDKGRPVAFPQNQPLINQLAKNIAVKGVSCDRILGRLKSTVPNQPMEVGQGDHLIVHGGDDPIHNFAPESGAEDNHRDQPRQNGCPTLR
jgi:hypothetical protein